MRQCPKCQKEVEQNAVFCPACGERIVTEEPKKNAKLPLIIVLSVAGAAAAVILIIVLVLLPLSKKTAPVEETAGVEKATVTETVEPEEEPAQNVKDESVLEKAEEEEWQDSATIHRYELILSDVSWKEAFQDCLNRGGYLAHMNSPEEYAVITEQIRSEGKTDYTFWLGANRANPSGEYRWINPDGSVGDLLDTPENRDLWLPGEPSYEGEAEEGAVETESCVDLLFRSSDDRFYWNDVPEDVVAAASYLKGMFGYICEYEDTEGSDAEGYQSLILGNWLLPGSNRAYMSFSPDGTVYGYEYMEDPYRIEGDTLIIDQTYTKTRQYFTIVRLDGDWLGLVETDSSGRTADAENAVYGYRSESPVWYTDPALEIENYGCWVLKDLRDDGLDDDIKGLYFNNGFFEEYYGDPDLETGDKPSWTMAATGCPGAVIARDGKITIYGGPDDVLASYEYRVDGDSLFVKDASGEHEFEKVVY